MLKILASGQHCKKKAKANEKPKEYSWPAGHSLLTVVVEDFNKTQSHNIKIKCPGYNQKSLSKGLRTYNQLLCEKIKR
jgi:hypothetical protein